MNGLISAMMVIAVCIVPVTMMAAGWILSGLEQSEPNRYMGFRTKLSMSSPQAWAFANRYCASVWHRWGLWMLAVSAAMVLIIIWAVLADGGSLESVPTLILWTVLGTVSAQVAVMIVSIAAVQKQLRLRFTPDGKPRAVQGRSIGGH